MKFLLIFALVGVFLFAAGIVFLRVDSARLARWIRDLAQVTRYLPILLMLLAGQFSRLGLLLWLARRIIMAGWRRRAVSGAAMNEARARAILGVRADASEAEIQAAWRAIMRRHHPDKGGDASTAALANQARDYLLHRGRAA